MQTVHLHSHPYDLHSCHVSCFIPSRCWGDCVSTYQTCGNPGQVANARCRQLAASLRVAPPGSPQCYTLSRGSQPPAPTLAWALLAAAAAAAAALCTPLSI